MNGSRSLAFSTTVADDLTVEAFCLQQGETRAMLISATVCSVATDLCDQLRQTIEAYKAKEAAGETERFLMGGHEVGGMKEIAQETVVRDWYDPHRVEAKIHEEFPEAETIFLPEFPTAKDNEKVLVAATRHKEVVFITYCNSRPYQGTDCLTRRAEAVINALIVSDKVSAVLHFGNPKAMVEIEHVPRRLFGYMMPDSQLHAIEVLAGKLPAKGTLPFKVELK